MAQVRFAETTNTLVNTTAGTTETIVLSSPIIETPCDLARVVVLCYCVLVTGATTSSITQRVRRGTVVTGTLIGSPVAENLKAAAGGTEEFFTMVQDSVSTQASVQYVYTIQAGTAATGTIAQATMLVLVL